MSSPGYPSFTAPRGSLGDTEVFGNTELHPELWLPSPPGVFVVTLAVSCHLVCGLGAVGVRHCPRAPVDPSGPQILGSPSPQLSECELAQTLDPEWGIFLWISSCGLKASTEVLKRTVSHQQGSDSSSEGQVLRARPTFWAKSVWLWGRGSSRATGRDVSLQVPCVAPALLRPQSAETDVLHP